MLTIHVNRRQFPVALHELKLNIQTSHSIINGTAVVRSPLFRLTLGGTTYIFKVPRDIGVFSYHTEFQAGPPIIVWLKKHNGGDGYRDTVYELHPLTSKKKTSISPPGDVNTISAYDGKQELVSLDTIVSGQSLQFDSNKLSYITPAGSMWMAYERTHPNAQKINKATTGAFIRWIKTHLCLDLSVYPNLILSGDMIAYWLIDKVDECHVLRLDMRFTYNTSDKTITKLIHDLQHCRKGATPRVSRPTRHTSQLDLIGPRQSDPKIRVTIHNNTYASPYACIASGEPYTQIGFDGTDLWLTTAAKLCYEFNILIDPNPTQCNVDFWSHSSMIIIDVRDPLSPAKCKVGQVFHRGFIFQIIYCDKRLFSIAGLSVLNQGLSRHLLI